MAAPPPSSDPVRAGAREAMLACIISASKLIVFSHHDSDVLTECGEALRTPIGSIHWAGTETATEWIGYMNGMR